MLESLLEPLGGAAALAATCPPAWLFLVLALPHLWYMWVIVHPASTKRTAALFNVDAVEWFAGVSLALNVAQIAALGAFVFTCGRFTAAGVAAQLAAQPWRAVCVPMFALGAVFKYTIFTAIGKKGVYYGAKFGHTIPWVHGFPFSVTAHPQYLGSSLCIAAAGIFIHDAAYPGHALLPAWWITCYVLTGLAEEGLCHSCEPFAASTDLLRDPREDTTSRPVVTAEAARLALLAPLVALQWALFAAILLAFLLGRRIIEAVFSPARAAPLVRTFTRLSARLMLLSLGYFVDVEGRDAVAAVCNANTRFAVVSNAISYLDVLTLTAALGPLALRSPAPARGAPLARLLLGRGVASAAVPALAFPERSHSAGGVLLSFRSGAFPSEAPAVLPVTLAYRAANSFNAAWPQQDGALPLLAHAARLTASWMKHARVQVLPLRAPSRGEDAAAFKTSVQNAMASALGWPVTSWGDAGAAKWRGRRALLWRGEPDEQPFLGARAAASPSPEPRSPPPRGRSKGRSASAAGASPAASPAPPSTARRARARRTAAA